jgi:transposase-like protein
MFGVGIEVGERYFGGNYKTIPDGIAYSEFFPDKKNTINGIENLWTHGKHHMPNFNSVPKAKFG